MPVLVCRDTAARIARMGGRKPESPTEVWWSWWVRLKTKRFCDEKALREALRWDSVIVSMMLEAALETALDATVRCHEVLV